MRWAFTSKSFHRWRWKGGWVCEWPTNRLPAQTWTPSCWLEETAGRRSTSLLNSAFQSWLCHLKAVWGEGIKSIGYEVYITISHPFKFFPFPSQFLGSLYLSSCAASQNSKFFLLYFAKQFCFLCFIYCSLNQILRHNFSELSDYVSVMLTTTITFFSKRNSVSSFNTTLIFFFFSSWLLWWFFTLHFPTSLAPQDNLKWWESQTGLPSLQTFPWRSCMTL